MRRRVTDRLPLLRRSRFEYRDSAGLHVVKEFELDPASYLVSFNVSVMQGENRLAPLIEWGPGLGDTDRGVRSSASVARGLFSTANKVTRLAACRCRRTSELPGRLSIRRHR